MPIDQEISNKLRKKKKNKNSTCLPQKNANDSRDQTMAQKANNMEAENDRGQRKLERFIDAN